MKDEKLRDFLGVKPDWIGGLTEHVAFNTGCSHEPKGHLGIIKDQLDHLRDRIEALEKDIKKSKQKNKKRICFGVDGE